MEGQGQADLILARIEWLDRKWVFASGPCALVFEAGSELDDVGQLERGERGAVENADATSSETIGSPP